MSIPKKLQTKKYEDKARTADSVVTFALFDRVLKASGETDLYSVSIAFAEAHTALDIPVYTERKTGIVWVTSKDAETLFDYMMDH